MVLRWPEDGPKNQTTCCLIFVFDGLYLDGLNMAPTWPECGLNMVKLGPKVPPRWFQYGSKMVPNIKQHVAFLFVLAYIDSVGPKYQQDG